MQKPIPSFIYSKANQIFTILFVPLFVLVFIRIFNPFDFDSLGNIINANINISDDSKNWLVALIMVICGMAVGSISRVIMGAYTKRHKLSYIGYIVWILGEIGVMASLIILF